MDFLHLSVVKPFKNKIILCKFIFLIFISPPIILTANESSLDFSGQFSTFFQSARGFNGFSSSLGFGYIPEISYSFEGNPDGGNTDLLMSLNVNGSAQNVSETENNYRADVSPYRVWMRYSSSSGQLEVRFGLQKINFGSAILLRPLQWFNNIDSTDPLQQTYGVYGMLTRYYFLNNANLWFWLLLQNQSTRGFDLIESDPIYPEVGGRIQFPLSTGELALSLHYRTANSSQQLLLPSKEYIPEVRVGVDGKWDVGVGLWFEMSYIHSFANLSQFTDQSLMVIGSDYTFSLGNGLNILVEHLVTSYDNTPFDLVNPIHVSALRSTYPLGLFDNMSLSFSYLWENNFYNFLLSHEHQFENVTGYFMFFLNPFSTLANSSLSNQTDDSGFRVMIVFNY